MGGTLRRVLVANRGEIAVRVMRTCKERGIETVAVYSDADRNALHVQVADHAVHLGGSAARDSYLDADKVLAACRDSGADAVHPGYGFLSENAAFADAVEAAGLVFIGPKSDSMRAMGDKPTARATVTKAGVPVVPGDNGPGGRGFPDTETALQAARKIGFPVMLKAAAGGGGRGMRLVDDPGKFEAAYQGAEREAKAAFGDDAVYLEKAIVRPRHVEVQVFADTHGHTVHMGERDCSIQRRHQKVVEESPSPAVSPELRARMGDIAVKAAQACDYRGAGTIEFLLADDGSFYFLEMNTRLQVEHPVTEMVLGLDLVAWQIDVAEGKPLPLDQAAIDARRDGAAIECRIYAEDPVRFFPAPGRIDHLRVPAGPYVRDDSGVTAGAEISTFYDPMISKLVAWGRDRAEAIGRMQRALAEYHISGTLKTNLPFHRRLLAHPAFVEGTFDTSFIEREKKVLLAPHELEGTALEAAAIASALEDMHANRVPPARADAADHSLTPWQLASRR